MGNVSTKKEKQQVFVAYAYSLYPKKDYRKIFTDLEKLYDVSFIFADEKITNQHILEKIISYMKGSVFSIFDISGWNPNVTLELGLAYGYGYKWYLCLDPSKTSMGEVPSDLKGIDRIQYNSYSEYQEKLTLLLEQNFPKRAPTVGLEDYMANLEKNAQTIIEATPGLKIKDIATLLGTTVEIAKIVVPKLVGKTIRAEGVRKGMKYYPRND